MRALLVLLALAFCGCAPVRPWEREALLRPCMAASLEPLETALEVHVHRTREGLLGAAQGGGASCGCN